MVELRTEAGQAPDTALSPDDVPYQYPDPVAMRQVVGGMPSHAVQVATQAVGNGHRMSRWYPYDQSTLSASTSCTECLAYIVANVRSGVAWEVDPGIGLICPARDGGEDCRRAAAFIAQRREETARAKEAWLAGADLNDDGDDDDDDAGAAACP